MTCPNIPSNFFTDSGNGTSAYFIYPNGTIRAKIVDGTFHVRPGKNICFLTDENVNAIFQCNKEITNIDAGVNTLTLTLSNATVIVATQIPALGLTPFDYKQKESPLRYSAKHFGHPIVNAYNGAATGITLAQLQLQLPTLLNVAGTGILSLVDVDVAIH